MALAWIMVFLTIAMTTIGQVLVKWQVMRAPPPDGGGIDIAIWALSMLSKPAIIAVFALVGASGLCWFVALSRLPLGHTYPFMGLTFPFVVLASAFILGESVSAGQLVGTTLVVAGVFVLGLSFGR